MVRRVRGWGLLNRLGLRADVAECAIGEGDVRAERILEGAAAADRPQRHWLLRRTLGAIDGPPEMTNTQNSKLQAPQRGKMTRVTPMLGRSSKND